MSKPLKPPLTISQHISLLRSRGMSVDEDVAAQWLSNVSYYRLSAYWYPARAAMADATRRDDFVEGTSFNDAIGLYEADRKLRTLIHDGIERIEIAMRTRVGEQICKNDPLGYASPDRFRPTFNHNQWMITAQRRINRALKQNAAIEHYRSKYGGEYPFGVLAEVLDFADISRLFEGLPASDQREIAEGLNIRIDMTMLSRSQQAKSKSQSPLARWLEQLTIVRNTSAHHGRVWNRSFTPAPTEALRTQKPFRYLARGQSERIFGSLTLMSHLLRTTSPGATWPDKVTTLIKDEFLTNPLVSPRSLGLPENWNERL